jgi:beta-glucosidase
MSDATFPADFTFGTATAAYQIEGAPREDGRGPSIWDVFSHTPGKVLGGDTGDVACDHYRRWEADLDLLVELGVDAYRFSVSWPRIQPDGRGRGNQRGLAFYERLVDGLLARGITPYVTLYHWDLPQALEDRGGWPERDTAGRFTDYAELVHGALGDRVKHWTTLNEPWCSAMLGYGAGVHAPGVQDPRAAYRAAHHLLLGHGQAIAAMRGGRRTGWDNAFSLTLNLHPVTPQDPDEDGDVDAARRIDAIQNRLWLDPVLRGAYADDVIDLFRDAGAEEAIAERDEGIIGEPIDFLGINYYYGHVVRAGTAQADAPPGRFPLADDVEVLPPEGETTAMGWEINPDGLRETLERVQRDHPALPLVITENGAAFDDVVGADGRVEDPRRVAYLEAHLHAAARALRDGVPLQGYFAWSLLDNFEWALGYSKRFGIVHVDYATQERRMKSSARFYADVLRDRRVG